MDNSYSNKSGTWKDKNRKVHYDEDDDTRYSYSDANEDKRDILIQDSMFRAGCEQKPVN